MPKIRTQDMSHERTIINAFRVTYSLVMTSQELNALAHILIGVSYNHVIFQMGLGLEVELILRLISHITWHQNTL